MDFSFQDKNPRYLPIFSSPRRLRMSNTSANSDNDNDVGSFNSSSFTSSADNDVSIPYTSAPKAEISNDGDSCTWYSGAICSRPRSCFDCLNVVIPGQDCAISPHGECMNSYMVSNIGGYPMANFTYCSANDPICSACRTTWTSDYTAGVQISPIATCVGASDCLCLSSCEIPDHGDKIVDTWCNPELDNSLFRLVAGFIIGTIVLFVVATILTKRQLARRLRQDFENSEARSVARAALRETRRPMASAHLPQLSLSGWADMREKLVSSEHSRLGGPSRAPPPILASSSATPPVALVEQGEGYRPMSPTEHGTRREI